MINVFRAGLVVLATTLTLGCTTTDPYTGESRYDPDATAALIGGLAVAGAVAYATSSDDDEDRHEHHRYHRDYQHTDYYGGRTYRPDRDVTCYDHQRACYHRQSYSENWSRRQYGERYW
ncbi:MAG: hypothetical protein R6X17_07155 [Candidatus Competibacteraceae bacterium]